MCNEDFVKEFQILIIICELQKPQEQTIVRLLRGFNREIAYTIKLQPFMFFNDVIKLIINVERQLKRGMNKSVTRLRPEVQKSLSFPSWDQLQLHIQNVYMKPNVNIISSTSPSPTGWSLRARGIEG